MIVTFIKPNIGSMEQKKFTPLDKMQPLSLGILASLTPSDIKIKFYDDRIEEIPYDEPTNLAAITVETFTAKRAYQIAKEYRNREVPVILGGFHPTLLPEEAVNYADSIVIGEAENLWPYIINDLKNNNLKKTYCSPKNFSLQYVRPNREIFQGKKYLPLNLVEFGRGCKFRCNFCAVSSFYKHSYRHHLIDEVIQEIKTLERKKVVFFVDDNIVADHDVAKRFFLELIPLKIKWIAQGSIDFALNTELTDLMAKSGCIGLLIGFESLIKENLTQMSKSANLKIKDYSALINKLREKGIMIYGTFIFGYDHDDRESINKTLDFAIKNKLLIANFNHLVPFPGTVLYEKFLKEKRLLYEKWWLEDTYRYGDVVFQPKLMSSKELKTTAMECRIEFNNWYSILKRIEFKANCKSIKNLVTYLASNLISQKEILKKNNMRLGYENNSYKT